MARLEISNPVHHDDYVEYSVNVLDTRLATRITHVPRSAPRLPFLSINTIEFLRWYPKYDEIVVHVRRTVGPYVLQDNSSFTDVYIECLVELEGEQFIQTRKRTFHYENHAAAAVVDSSFLDTTNNSYRYSYTSDDRLMLTIIY